MSELQEFIDDFRETFLSANGLTSIILIYLGAFIGLMTSDIGGFLFVMFYGIGGVLIGAYVERNFPRGVVK